MSDPGEQISWRVQGPIYAAAFFFGPLQTLATMSAALFVAGLISVELPFLIAFVLASRQILTVVLSVNSGALVDRFGSRNATIAFGSLAVLTALAYPVIPGLLDVQWGTAVSGTPAWALIAALIGVQVAAGYAEGNTWVGIQAMVSHALRGQPTYAGRLVFTARLGGIAGPLMMGQAWDIWGVLGGFGLLAAWIAGGTIATVFVPRRSGTQDAAAEPDPPEETDSAASSKPARSKGPGLAESLKLLLIPAVMLVMMLTVLRQAGSGIHSTFYVVWLDKEIGLSGSLIGGLMSTANVASAVTAIMTGCMARRFPHHWLLIVTIAMAIVGTAIVPALGSVYVLLMMAISIRGIGQGLNLPMMIAMLAQHVPVGLQGRVTALRVAFNRGGGALVPLAAGAIAEVIGIANSFYVIGAGGIVLILALSVWVIRCPDFKPNR